MREVEVRLKRQKLADVLGEMRQWLDQHDCVPVSFDIARGRRGALLANVLFKEDHNAEAFLQDSGCRWLAKPFRLGDLLRAVRDGMS